MGVILDIVPKVTVIGGGGATDVDLSDVYQKINENKLAIGDLSDLTTEQKESLVKAINEVKTSLTNKAELARVEAIERYIISLEDRLSRIDIEIIDPASILFLD